MPNPQIDDVLSISEQILSLLQSGNNSAAALQKMLHTVTQGSLSHEQDARVKNMLQQAIVLADRLDNYHQHEFSLRVVSESAQALTELKALNAVLFEITERGRGLLGSDLAWVAGVDPHDQTLRALAYSGVFASDFSERQTPITGGVAGHVLKTRSSFSTHNYMDDERFQHTVSSDAMIHGESLASLVAVPLLSGSQVIGILLVGDRYTRHYQPREINILSTLAAHASVAVRNARAYEMTCKALEDTERANDQLLRQTSALEFAADAHERMSRMLAKGTQIPAMIATIVHILGGTLYYLDASGEPSCIESKNPNTSPPALDQLLEPAAIQTAMGTSHRSGQATQITRKLTEGHLRLAAVVSGDDVYGALLLHTPQPLSEAAGRILERSAMTIAILELSAEKKSSSLDRETHLLIRSLIERHTEADEEVLYQLEKQGYVPGSPLGLAFIQMEKSNLSFILRRLRHRFRQPGYLMTALEDGIIMIYPHTESFQQELQKLLFQDHPTQGVACLSGPHAAPHLLAQAYTSIRQVSRLAEQLGRQNCIIHEAELRMYAVLFSNQSKAELEQMLDLILGPLLRHDEKRASRLCQTLLCYVNHLQNATLTAKHLGIHVNTLHNRLEQIRHLLGSWEQRPIEVHMALQLQQLLSQEDKKG